MELKTFIKATNEYCSIATPVAAPILRKGFDLDFIPETAEIKVCVSGFYHLYVNGERITKGELAPFINNPNHILYYDKYEIADRLKKGRNAIAVILGNGFINQDVDSWDFSKASFRNAPCTAITLEIKGEGKVLEIESDESFKTHPSPILFDMYRYGTVYDAREEIEGCFDGDFDDSIWDNAMVCEPPKGDIMHCTALPVVTQYELKPVSKQRQSDFHYLIDKDGTPFECTYIKDGWLYDFGLNCAGVVRLKIKGERGQKITLRHGEALCDGKFNINSIFTIKEDLERFIHLLQADTYYLKGGEEEIFVPAFTYHGFRYVFVEGITPEQATDDLVTYQVMNSDIKKRTFFESSDATLNALYDMGIRADMSNFHHFPTDCPHREKNGWTGDASVSAEQLLLNFYCSENFRVWLESARYAQIESGQIPGIIPTDTWGYKWGSGPVWDSAIVNLPYYSYKFDGRIDVFSENADMISRYLKYIAGKRDENGLIACGLGDWCQPGSDNIRISSPLCFTDSAQIMETAEKSAFLFDVVGRADDKAYALKLRDALKCAIRENLIDFETMTVAGACQTSQSVAIYLDIFNTDEKERAYARLIDFIKEKDYHLDCGMFGLRYIFHVLFDNGDGEIALKMITRPDGPSYGNMIALGGTALFEATEQNGVQESQNHHFYGDILNLFISKLVGLRINPNMNDINEVEIKPYLPDSIDFANASYDFSSGTITVKVTKDNGKLKVEANVPEGIYGRIIANGEAVELKTGMNVL